MKNDAIVQCDAMEVVIINPVIWKSSNLPRVKFLQTMKQVKAIRIRTTSWSLEGYDDWPVFSYFPRSVDAWTLLERLHNLVNNGDFSPFDERVKDHVFAVMLPRKVANWFLNTKIVTIQ